MWNAIAKTECGNYRHFWIEGCWWVGGGRVYGSVEEVEKIGGYECKYFDSVDAFEDWAITETGAGFQRT